MSVEADYDKYGCLFEQHPDKDMPEDEVNRRDADGTLRRF
jgi:hypothetical protein